MPSWIEVMCSFYYENNELFIPILLGLVFFIFQGEKWEKGRNKMKKIGVWFLSLMVALSIILPFAEFEAKAKAFDPNAEYKDINLRFWNDEKPNQRFYINAASRYILETVQKPEMGSTFGEWSVMDLLRGMYIGADYINYIPENYFTDYKSRIDTYIKEVDGNLDRNKSTEWSRLTLSMTSLGYPITDIAGYDFLDRLAQSHKFSYRQGINGPIWEIIALNTGGYEFPETPSNYVEGDINTVGKMIDYIMKLEITDKTNKKGGWALFGKVPDPDITGMALQSLAPYYVDASKYPKKDINTSYEDFKKAVERAIKVLSEIQADGGAYKAFGNINAESTTQVIVALTAMNMDPKAKVIDLPTINDKAHFNQKGGVNDGVYTDNMMDALYTFFAERSGSSPEVSGFKHVTSGYDGGGGSGTGVNAMGTDQSLYGLIAYDRYINKEKPLYDMTDQSNGQYKNMKAKKFKVLFDTEGTTSEETYSPYATLKIPASSPTSNAKVITWNTKKDGSGVAYLPNELLVMPEQNITLYAQFENQYFAINYELNGGEFNKKVIDRFSPTNKENLPTEKDVERDGYTFVGWYDNPAFIGVGVTTIAQGTSSEQKFYAKWADPNALAKEVIQLITELPQNIQIEHKNKITTVRAAYSKLSNEGKMKIHNYSKLLDAEAQLDILINGEQGEVSNEKVAARIILLIDSIDYENIVLEDQSVIQNARKLYNAMSATQKRLVTNYSSLIKAEKKLEKLEAVEVDGVMAQNVINSINALPSKAKLKLSDAEVVNQSRFEFDSLKFTQQKMVTNHNTLVQVELQLETLANEAKLQVNSVKNNAVTVTGTATKNKTVAIYINGSRVSSSKASNDGKFTVKITKQKAGTKLVVKTTEASKTITVEASKTLAYPKVNTVGAKSTTITGTAEKSATINAYVNNKKIGTSKISSKGNYSIKIKAQKAKTKIQLVVTDSMNNKSKAKTIIVVAAKTLSLPKVKTVTTKSTKVTGTATKGTTITLYSKSNKKITSAKVNSKGNFSLTIKKQKKNTVLKLKTNDAMNNTSKVKSITVK